MICYFDASALAKRYIEEKHSAAIVRLLGESTAVASRLSELEIGSALARRCREGVLSPPARDAAMRALRHDLEAIFVVELHSDVVTEARSALLRYPLRAADAVQLGAALTIRERTRADLHFVTFDSRLEDAAVSEGLRTGLP